MCIWSSSSQTYLDRFPTINANSLVQVKNSAEGMKKLGDDTCKGFLNSGSEAEILLKSKAHCNKMIVGQPAMSIWLSQPVNIRWARPLSYWIVELISKGELEKVNAKHVTKDYCVANAKDEAKNKEDAGKMGARDFIGTFCMSYSVMLFGLLYRLFRLCTGQMKRR